MKNAPFKTYLVAISSQYVREAIISLNTDLEFSIPNIQTLNDVTVIVGATGGHSKEEALHKIARNYELPSEILTVFEVSA